MKRRNRAASKERRSDRLAQAKADAEVREDWLAAVHGSAEDLRLIASDTREGKAARQAVLANDEVPDGVTHAMLRRAAAKAIGS